MPPFLFLKKVQREKGSEVQRTFDFLIMNDECDWITGLSDDWIFGCYRLSVKRQRLCERNKNYLSLRGATKERRGKLSVCQHRLNI